MAQNAERSEHASGHTPYTGPRAHCKACFTHVNNAQVPTIFPQPVDNLPYLPLSQGAFSKQIFLSNTRTCAHAHARTCKCIDA